MQRKPRAQRSSPQGGTHPHPDLQAHRSGGEAARGVRMSGFLSKTLASIVESTGAKGVSDLWKTTLGARIFFDGNLL